MSVLITTESTRDTVVRLLLAALVVALFAVAGIKVLSDPKFLEVFAGLKHTNPLWIAGIAGVFLVSSFLNAELTRVVVNRLRYRVTMGQAFAAFMVRIYGNLLFAKAGIGMSAAFMRVRYGVRIADFGSMLVGVTILQFLCIGVAGLVGQSLLLFAYDVPVDVPVAIAFLGCVAGSGVGLMVPIRVSGSLPAAIAKFLERVDGGIGQVRPRSRGETGILTLLTLQSAVIALRAVRLWLAFAAVGTAVNPAGLLVASLLGDIGLLVGVTPMGLGFREAAIGYSAQLMGAAAPTAVAVTLVDRAIWSITVVLVTHIVVLASLFRKRKAIATEKNCPPSPGADPTATGRDGSGIEPHHSHQ